MGDWKALPRGSFFRSARLDCALSLLSGAMVREEESGGRKCVIYRVDEKNSPIL